MDYHDSPDDDAMFGWRTPFSSTPSYDMIELKDLHVGGLWFIEHLLG